MEKELAFKAHAWVRPMPACRYIR